VRILLTGAAGFIGYHVAERLLARGDAVVGIDNLNSYYDVGLKLARLGRLARWPKFSFLRVDLADKRALIDLRPSIADVKSIIHLAAQAGVRHSVEDPYVYISSNVMGHLSVLELARSLPDLRHLVYASSSSVYGANARVPFDETDRVDTPLSVYAATKRADELLSYSYSHLFAVPQTGLRFFTVYGPWGRPDMAYYSFARAIIAGEPITVFDDGQVRRDFTYIDDIVSGVVACLDRPPPSGGGGGASRILNLGNSRSESVAHLVSLLEDGLGRRARVRLVRRPASDVPETFASVRRVADLTGFAPSIPLATGIARFVAWFRGWYGIR
jgi:UDP-glucuronate 4-epimerase